MVKLVYFVAVLLILFNKAALSSYRFPCANVITLFQVKIQKFSPEIDSVIFILVHVRCFLLVLQISCFLSLADDKFMFFSLCFETVEDYIFRRQ